MENGSGGFMANLTFVGGNFGYGFIPISTWCVKLSPES